MKSQDKLWKVVKSCEKLWKVLKSCEQQWKVKTSGEKLPKVVKTVKSCQKLWKVVKSNIKLWKVGKNWENCRVAVNLLFRLFCSYHFKHCFLSIYTSKYHGFAPFHIEMNSNRIWSLMQNILGGGGSKKFSHLGGGGSAYVLKKHIRDTFSFWNLP